MKRTAVFLAILFATSGLAQISFPKEDWLNLVKPENNFLLHIAFNVTLDIGEPGKTSWDFSSVQPETTTSVSIGAPQSTAFSDYYPDATFCIFAEGTIWSYGFLSGDTLMSDGEVITIENADPFFVFTRPAQPRLLFPATFGAQWGWSGVQILETGGGHNSTPAVNFSAIDAYGSMRLSVDKTVEALRLRSVDGLIVSGDTLKNTLYTFLSLKNLVFLYTSGDPLGGEVNVGTFMWFEDTTRTLTLARIQVTPDQAMLNLQEQLQFEASAFDPFDNPVSSQFVWSATGGVIDSTGLYTATESGDFQVTASCFDGSISGAASVHINPTHVSSRMATPLKFSLDRNYPNPFNPRTTIHFETPTEADVRLAIYNALGQEVATIFNRRVAAGAHRVVWDASQQDGGVYFCRMQAEEFESTIKLLLMK